jgi:hypothetical protein
MNNPNGLKPKKSGRKLRCGINCRWNLKQNRVKQKCVQQDKGAKGHALLTVGMQNESIMIRQ